MARKSLNELSGIADAIARSGAKAKEGAPRSTAPALGALQGSLSAIREIDPDLIDDWGPKDRLDGFTAVNSDDDADGFEALTDSIRNDGQQVPILIRRSKTEGRYEAIYGRRRLQACRSLGIKVKANVQDIDDDTALLAKGLENAARRNLSFYEKARFAAAIQDAGHDTATVRKVLGLSKSGLSHLTKVTENVPDAVGDLIGPAPKSGRPKWTALADAFAKKSVTNNTAAPLLRKLQDNVGSDDRLEALLKNIAQRGAQQRVTETKSPMDGVTINSGKSGVALTVKRTGKSAPFANWLDQNLEAIIQKSYAEFTAVNPAKDQK